MTVGDLGPRAEGRAGAFAAEAGDLTAIEYNPAGLTFIGGTQFYLSNRFGFINERYKRASTTIDFDTGEQHHFSTVRNETPWQLINPVVAAGSSFGLESWAFAIGAYAPPGIATQEFPDDGGQRYMLLKRDVKILYFNLSAAWRFKDLFGIGASIQWVDAAQIELSMVVSGDDYGIVDPVEALYDFEATLKGADHIGVSGIVGAWVQPWPFLRFALSGRVAPTTIDAECELTVKSIELAEDPVLTRAGQSANNVDLSMKLPPMGRFGVQYMHHAGTRRIFDIEFDFIYEAWHLTDAYILNGHGLLATLDRHEIPIDRIVLPKNWKDTFSVRLGGDYYVIDQWLTLRAGAFYESGAMQREYAYIDFNASQKVGGAVGTSVMFYGFDVSLSYNFIWAVPFSLTEEEGKIYQQAPGSPCRPPYTDETLCDPDYLGQPAAVANAGEYKAHYHFTTLSVSYTF